MNKWWLIIIVLAIAGGFYILNGKSVNYSPTTMNQTIKPTVTPNTPSSMPTATTAPSTSEKQTSKVEIKDFAFNPDLATVKVGTTVTWTNNDSVPHTITSDNGTFDSKTIQPGANFSFTFDKAGTFDYLCSIHTSMHGKIVVTP